MRNVMNSDHKSAPSALIEYATIVMLHMIGQGHCIQYFFEYINGLQLDMLFIIICKKTSVI